MTVHCVQPSFKMANGGNLHCDIYTDITVRNYKLGLFSRTLTSNKTYSYCYISASKL